MLEEKDVHNAFLAVGPTDWGMSREGPGPGGDSSTEFAGPRSRGAWAAAGTTVIHCTRRDFVGSIPELGRAQVLQVVGSASDSVPRPVTRALSGRATTTIATSNCVGPS